MSTVRAKSWLPAFIFLAFVWGGSFLFIKVGVGALHPLQLTLARVGVGAITLLVALVVMRKALPRDPKVWGHLAVVAVFLNVVPFTLFGYGEQTASSIMAGIMNATTPLWTLLVTLLMLPTERPTRDRILGLLISFGGVLVVLGVWQSPERGALGGALACLAAAASYGVGGVYQRKFISGRPESNVSLATAQLLIATGQLAIITPLAGVSLIPTGPLPLAAIASVLVLGAIGTGIATLLIFRVIRLAGITTASTVTYLLPVVAAIIGITVLREHLTWNQPVGAAIVLVAVAISQGVLKRRPRLGSDAHQPGEAHEDRPALAREPA